MPLLLPLKRLVDYIDTFNREIEIQKLSQQFFNSPKPFGSQGELIVYPFRRSQKISSVLFSETACLIKAKFYVEPPWVGRRKVCSRHRVTWPSWPPRPYMIKTLQKSSPPEPANHFLETWQVASWTPAHHSLYKWWPWVDLDIFYCKVKFGNVFFSIGKSETETIATCGLRVTPLEIKALTLVWRPYGPFKTHQRNTFDMSYKMSLMPNCKSSFILYQVQ